MTDRERLEEILSAHEVWPRAYGDAFDDRKKLVADLLTWKATPTVTREQINRVLNNWKFLMTENIANLPGLCDELLALLNGEPEHCEKCGHILEEKR